MIWDIEGIFVGLGRYPIFFSSILPLKQRETIALAPCFFSDSSQGNA
jgi:hypothetical protein